jgi:hypothetical protein
MNTERLLSSIMMMLVTASLLLAACAPAASLPVTPPQGSWSGITGDPVNPIYSVNMTFEACSPNAECAAVSYVDEDWTCSGTLTYVGVEGDQYVFEEKLTGSTGEIECATTGVVKMKPQTDGTWAWGWYFSRNEAEAAGTTVVQEIKQPG